MAESEIARTERALPRPGEVFDGRYHIVAKLGQGGMGAVFKVQQVFDDRFLALKVRLPDSDTSSELAKRFAQEKEILAKLRKLNNDHITKITDAGVSNGVEYFVMELLDGRDLRKELVARERLTPSEAIDYVLQTCQALGAAHHLGIVHRDIKPENLFLHRSGGETAVLKVLDFGIARVASSQIRGVTRGAGVPLTPGYASPEQVAGANTDARTDIFSLGIVLHELIAGEHPFQDSNIFGQRRTLLGVSHALTKVVKTCLASQLSDRYANVAALAAALAEVEEAPLRRTAGAAQAVADSLNTTLKVAAQRFRSADQLARALRGRKRVIFLFGAGLTQPTGNEIGVPGVKDMLALIRKRFERAKDTEALKELDKLEEESAGVYQQAFALLRESDPELPNIVVREAVLEARFKAPPTAELERIVKGNPEACTALERDLQGWYVSRGLRAVGWLAANCPGKYGSTILTSNFDPLIAVALERENRSTESIVLALDGSVKWRDERTKGSRVVHFHGDWFRSDTMHTQDQLRAKREKLARSLEQLLSSGTLVVMAYGGWDDIMTKAIMNAFANQQAKPDVIWTFYEDDPALIQKRYPHVFEQLGDGIVRGRIHYYRGINVHEFLPRLQTDELAARPFTNPPPPHRQDRKRRYVVAALGVLALATFGIAGSALIPESDGRRPSVSVKVPDPKPLAPPPATTPPVLMTSNTAPSPAAFPFRVKIGALPGSRGCPALVEGATLDLTIGKSVYGGKWNKADCSFDYEVPLAAKVESGSLAPKRIQCALGPLSVPLSTSDVMVAPRLNFQNCSGTGNTSCGSRSCLTKACCF